MTSVNSKIDDVAIVWLDGLQGQFAMEFSVEHVIHAAPAEVAKIMFDPDYEEQWVGKSGKTERLTPGPIAVGSRVRHDAGVFGATFSFVTEVTVLEPDHLLEMNIVEGPVRGALVYEVAPTAGGSIAIVHVRNHAIAPVLRSTWARKQQVSDNLERLAALVVHSRS